jgi:hypothetical protein
MNMIKNIAIYGLTTEVPRPDTLQSFAPDAKISSLSPTSFRIEWENMAITMNLMPSSQIQQHLQGLLGFALQMGGSEEMVKEFSQVKQVFGLIIEQGSADKTELRAFILGLSAEYNGYFFSENAMYSAMNRLIFGFPNSRLNFFPSELHADEPL